MSGVGRSRVREGAGRERDTVKPYVCTVKPLVGSL